MSKHHKNRCNNYCNCSMNDIDPRGMQMGMGMGPGMDMGMGMGMGMCPRNIPMQGTCVQTPQGPVCNIFPQGMRDQCR